MIARHALAAGSVLILLCLTTAALAENAPLPADVRAFISRRDDCDHFRGETASDATRQAQIERQLRQLCTGTDRELARLLRRYAQNAAVMTALDTYDRNIEGN